jgi:hypothetical protein
VFWAGQSATKPRTAMVTLALRERVPEGRVREPPRSDSRARGNSLTPTLSRLRDVALQREGSGGEGEFGLDGKGYSCLLNFFDKISILHTLRPQYL